MLGQQLPCSITVPAEGRDLGRSQWHFSSHKRLPSPAWLLLTPELLLSSCALQSGKQSCDRDTRVHTNPASTPRPLESSGKILQNKWLFLPQMFIVVLLPALAGGGGGGTLVCYPVTLAQKSLQDQTSPRSEPKRLLPPLPAYTGEVSTMANMHSQQALHKGFRNSALF